jgi:hypothetical protein
VADFRSSYVGNSLKRDARLAGTLSSTAWCFDHGGSRSSGIHLGTLHFGRSRPSFVTHCSGCYPEGLRRLPVGSPKGSRAAADGCGVTLRLQAGVLTPILTPKRCWRQLLLDGAKRWLLLMFWKNSAWLLAFLALEGDRHNYRGETFNPLVQGSNPWGATTRNCRNKAKNGETDHCLIERQWRVYPNFYPNCADATHVELGLIPAPSPPAGSLPGRDGRRCSW